MTKTTPSWVIKPLVAEDFEQDHEDPQAVVPVFYSFPDTYYCYYQKSGRNGSRNLNRTNSEPNFSN